MCPAFRGGEVKAVGYRQYVSDWSLLLLTNRRCPLKVRRLKNRTLMSGLDSGQKSELFAARALSFKLVLQQQVESSDAISLFHTTSCAVEQSSLHLFLSADQRLVIAFKGLIVRIEDFATCLEAVSFLYLAVGIERSEFGLSIPLIDQVQ